MAVSEPALRLMQRVRSAAMVSIAVLLVSPLAGRELRPRKT